jgi:hypothetical protein
MRQPVDESGLPLSDGDYITFSFGIPQIGVTARISETSTGWVVNCLHPVDVKPKQIALKELTKNYQIYKAGEQRISDVLRALQAEGRG